MRRLFFALAAVVALSACEQINQPEDAVNAAEKCVKAGDFRGAVKAYERALDGSGNANVHYKMAVIYDDKLKRPLDAVHHYDRYLELAPDGIHAKEAKAARGDCEKRLQTKLSDGGFMSLAEGARLKNENESLRKTIAELRDPKPVAGPRVADPNAKDPLPPGARQHTVAKGDTLAKIALKYYKNRAYSGQIKDANFNQLGGKDAIKPGQVLIIPEMGKKPR